MIPAPDLLATWLERFRRGREAAYRVTVELTSEGGGPLTPAVRRAGDPEVWRGAVADQFVAVIGSLERGLDPVADHLGWLARELQAAEREAESSLRSLAAGVPVPGAFDPVATVNRLRTVPSPAAPSVGVWGAPYTRASGFVGLSPEAARGVAGELRRGADHLRTLARLLQEPFADLGLDVPAGFVIVADSAEAVADDIRRRVQALEDAAAAGDTASFEVPFGPGPTGAILADLFRSAGGRVLPESPPPAAVGPGSQPTQAKEADPVSTSTGNYFLQVVDLAQSGRGIPTAFIRTYNSLRTDVDGAVGFGWSHSLGVSLVVDDSGATVEWGDGRRQHHGRFESEFIPPPGVHDVLRRTGEGYEVVTKAKVRYQFDDRGLLLAVIDPSGNVSTLRRDESGALTAVQDASGIETTVERDDRARITAVVGALGRRWCYGYDETGLLVGVTDPEGGRTAYEYDAGRRLTAVVDPEGRLVVRNRYDDAGRVVEQVDGAGAVWRYSYEPGMTAVTDPLGQTKMFGFDEWYRTTGVGDPLGAVTTFGWDGDFNLAWVRDPTDRVFTFSWDGRGNVVAAMGPGTAPVTFVWDDADRLSAVVSADGDRATLRWDDHDRPVEVKTAAGVRTLVTWRDDGLPEAVIDGTGATTRYAYDPAGRPESFTDPLGFTTRMTFDEAGRPVWERHADGEEMAFEWDRADRLVAVTDAMGATVRFGYDRSGRLLTVTDALGRVTRYGYDERGFVATVTDPLDRPTTFGYDPCGRLVTRTDARGLPVSFTYDPAGRLVRIEAPDSSPITYTWDASGRLVGMTDGTGQTTWELDAAGRPAVEHRPDGTAIAHGYDPLGRRRRLELRRNGTVLTACDYDVDADGRITAVHSASTGLIRLTYDPAGRLADLAYPNGVTTTWSYDAVGQPVLLETAGPDGSGLETWRAAYDADGNRLRCERTNGADDTVSPSIYGYDGLGRLTSWTAASTTSTFAWDGAHNRIAGGPGGGARFDAGDQILDDGRDQYGHDAAGHLVARRSPTGDGQWRSCAYDALGRVAAIVSADEGEVRFTYDGLGRRSVRTDPIGVVRRVFDGTNLLAELAPDGHLTVETAAGLLVLARADATGVRFLHPGLSTEVAVVTDAAGRVVARSGYDPFGQKVGTDGDVAAAGPLGYCGTLGVREEAGGLLDMRARLYDPALGRFLSPDPWPASLPEPVTLNRYLYALGDPVSQVDPYGLWCWTGKSHGKCRGLKDVTQRVGESVKTPLEITSAVSSGVAAIATGVTVLCPVPCGVISGPVAATAGTIGTVTGIAATAAQCAAEWSLTDFRCAVGIASGALGSVVGAGVDVGRHLLGWSDATYRLAQFGTVIFGTFIQGSAAAADLRGK